MGLPIVGQPEGQSPAPPVAPVVEWFWELPDHLSATQMTMAARCLEQFRQRYVLGRKERPGGALVLGGAFHEAVAQNYRPKITSGVDSPVSDWTEAFANSFEVKVEEYGGNSEIEWDGNPGAEKDKGVGMIAAYRTQQAEHVQPIAVEEKFELWIPGMPVRIDGFIDSETETHVRDYKTAGSKPRNGVIKPQWRIQDLVYKVAKAKPSAWEIVTKTKVPGVFSPELGEVGLENPYSPALALIMQKRALTIATSISEAMARYGPDNPWPDALTHDWACNYCGYRPTCPWWGNDPNAQAG